MQHFGFHYNFTNYKFKVLGPLFAVKTILLSLAVPVIFASFIACLKRSKLHENSGKNVCVEVLRQLIKSWEDFL